MYVVLRKQLVVALPSVMYYNFLQHTCRTEGDGRKVERKKARGMRGRKGGEREEKVVKGRKKERGMRGRKGGEREEKVVKGRKKERGMRGRKGGEREEKVVKGRKKERGMRGRKGGERG